MDTYDYPGKGLSLSQLVHALNEKLRHVAYPPPFALDAFPQLEHDISTALSLVRGWKNTFARINRIPLDILYLISTHLPSQKDRFRVTFVCRHWRRVFLQHGTLWSQLFLGNNEDYMKTILDRAKGSALDVVATRGVPLATATLLSSHTRQIRHLELPYYQWADILMFSKINSGPLPLLRTLELHSVMIGNQVSQSTTSTTPALPLFSGAVNLEEFTFHPRGVESLSHFTFPNLTTFTLQTPPSLSLSAREFLNFLEASPMLRTVNVVSGSIIPGDTPQHMLVVLPNVETFSLFAMVGGWHVYHLATHISCPHAKNISLGQRVHDLDITPGLEIFPNPTLWKTIVRQHSTNPVEEVALETVDDGLVACSLAFRSPDGPTIRLGFCVISTGVEEEELELSWGELDLAIISQAFSTIRCHPLLSHLKRLHIQDALGNLGNGCELPMAGVVGDLFRCLGPLDVLTINGWDAAMFLAPFIDLPKFRHFERVFPHVKQFTILEGRMDDYPRFMDALVELAKSKHEKGTPFEHVTVEAIEIPAGTEERLEEWVSTVRCCKF